MAQSILTRLTEVIRETFDDESIEIDRDTIAQDVPGWDSLSHTILMLAIEEAFRVELPPDTQRFSNVGVMVDRIAELLPR